jgi:hypothetical protein
MSKRHYEAIAQALRDARASREICTVMADVLKRMHQGGYEFKHALFMRACGW